MAIDGTAVRTRGYYDDETDQVVKVNLSVRDIIYFDLLDKLIQAVKKDRR